MWCGWVLVSLHLKWIWFVLSPVCCGSRLPEQTVQALLPDRHVQRLRREVRSPGRPRRQGASSETALLLNLNSFYSDKTQRDEKNDLGLQSLLFCRYEPTVKLTCSDLKNQTITFTSSCTVNKNHEHILPFYSRPSLMGCRKEGKIRLQQIFTKQILTDSYFGPNKTALNLVKVKNQPEEWITIIGFSQESTQNLTF